MCISAPVDVAAGLVIGAVGLDALRHVNRRADLPLASLVLVFASHQLIEAFAWWGLQGKVPVAIGHAAEWLYLAIAFGVIPILVPVAVGALAKPAHRLRTGVFLTVGVIVSLDLMFALVRGPVDASISGHCIAYDVNLWHGGTVVALYVLATCGSLLASDQPHIRAWGALNLPAVILLAVVNQAGFISLWCVWAAITSVAIAIHLRHTPAGLRTRALAAASPGADGAGRPPPLAGRSADPDPRDLLP